MTALSGWMKTFRCSRNAIAGGLPALASVQLPAAVGNTVHTVVTCKTHQPAVCVGTWLDCQAHCQHNAVDPHCPAPGWIIVPAKTVVQEMF